MKQQKSIHSAKTKQISIYFFFVYNAQIKANIISSQQRTILKAKAQKKKSFETFMNEIKLRLRKIKHNTTPDFHLFI